MQYIHYYESPIGQILLTADEQGLTNLMLQGEPWTLTVDHLEETTPAIKESILWLDIYFSGNIPDFTPPLHLTGSPFQMKVWELLLKIPYGSITTYGYLAKQIAQQRGISRMSAQAVGGAVGSNPVSIIVPCHRVIGANGNLTGFASGLDNKIALLKQEGHDISKFSMPR
jgi:methylated-DNA-[protein]-cysteine S-methyltransferase